MAFRVFEVALIAAVAVFAAVLVVASGMITGMSKEQIALQELKAKQLILALDLLPATEPSLPPDTSVIDLLRMYYISQKQQYLSYARSDIYSYGRSMLPDSAWRVSTSDGKLVVESPLFDEARVCGSATVAILSSVNLSATVCAL